MQNKELCLSVEAIANEKRISQDEIFSALEEALALACEKNTGYLIRMTIDKNSGEFKTYRRWMVVENLLNFVDDDGEIPYDENKHIRFRDADGIEVDEFIEEPIEDIALGRVAAQIVKQVVMQKVRESERNRIVAEYQERIGETMNAIVKSSDYGTIFVDLGGIDGVVPRSESIPNELVRKGDRIKVFIKEAKTTPRGVQIILSRAAKEMMSALIEMEVPEVAEGIIEVMGVARDPGLRAKVAVRSKDKRIDPIGSCIGMRGSRIQAISDGVNGERVDMIMWNENDAEFVINAMSPAVVVSIIVDEDKHSMEVAVEDEQLAQAIGKNGQNIRLASEVTGWRLNVMSYTEMLEKQRTEEKKIEDVLIEKLDIDATIATLLVRNDIVSLDDILDMPDEELLKIEGFDVDLIEDLKERAQDGALAQALDDDEAAETLAGIEGVDEDLVEALVTSGISTQEDLAELSIDELLDIKTMERSQASEIILTARAPWFE